MRYNSTSEDYYLQTNDLYYRPANFTMSPTYAELVSGLCCVIVALALITCHLDQKERKVTYNVSGRKVR